MAGVNLVRNNIDDVWCLSLSISNVVIVPIFTIDRVSSLTVEDLQLVVLIVSVLSQREDLGQCLGLGDPLGKRVEEVRRGETKEAIRRFELVRL